MLRGFIFDLDGTLGDTLPICYAAFRRTLSHYVGRLFSDAEIAGMFGPSEEGILHRWVGDRVDAAMEMFLDEYCDAHRSCRAPFTGVVPVLERLADRGLRLGLVTGKGARTARISLQELGLEQWFADVETGSSAGGVKPAAIRTVLGRWGLPPHEVAYVGDTAYDMRAARDVGMIAAAAAWAPGTDADALRRTEPDHLFGSVQQLNRWIDQI